MNIREIVRKAWNEEEHPRTPAGSEHGGEFASAPRIGGTLPGGGKIQPGDIPWEQMHAEDQYKLREYYARAYGGKTGMAEGRDAFDKLSPNEKIQYAQGEGQGAFKKPEAKPTGWAAVPDDQKAMVRENFAQQWAENQQHKPGNMVNPPSTEDLKREGRDMFDNRLDDQGKLNHFNRMDADEFVKPEEKPLAPGLPSSQLGKEPRADAPEGGTTPSTPTPTPTPEEETFQAEEWDQLNGDQQEQAKDRWIEANRSAYLQDEIENWRQEDSNFEEVPKELSNDQEWIEDKIKEVNAGYYPGETVPGLDDSGGGTPEQHAEADRRAAAWRDSFSVDDSVKAGAFTLNEDGDLIVDTDNLVFKDNPHEGPEAEQQQMVPGVDREELSNAWKKAKWAEVHDDFESMMKDEFDKEVEKRVDNMKDNPPDYLAENVDEYMGEAWSQFDDREKFRQAEQYLSDLRGDGAGGGGDGGGRGRPANVRGTVEPDKKLDSPEQKKIQAKEGKSQKNLGGGVSVTQTVTMSDGSKYVWKPSTGEPSGYGIPAGSGYTREVAAYDIGRVVGMKNIMPTASIMQYKDHRGELVWGAMIDKIPNSHNDGTSGDKDFEDTAKRGTFFDYIIGNSDRHDNNWMSDDNGKLWLIDHGLSMHNGDARYGLFHSVIGAGASTREEIPESIRKPWRGKWDKIENILKRRGIPDKYIARIQERYNTALGDNVTWKDLGV